MDHKKHPVWLRFDHCAYATQSFQYLWIQHESYYWRKFTLKFKILCERISIFDYVVRKHRVKIHIRLGSVNRTTLETLSSLDNLLGHTRFFSTRRKHSKKWPLWSQLKHILYLLRKILQFFSRKSSQLHLNFGLLHRCNFANAPQLMCLCSQKSGTSKLLHGIVPYESTSSIS